MTTRNSYRGATLPIKRPVYNLRKNSGPQVVIIPMPVHWAPSAVAASNWTSFTANGSAGFSATSDGSSVAVIPADLSASFRGKKGRYVFNITSLSAGSVDFSVDGDATEANDGADTGSVVSVEGGTKGVQKATFTTTGVKTVYIQHSGSSTLKLKPKFTFNEAAATITVDEFEAGTVSNFAYVNLQTGEYEDAVVGQGGSVSWDVMEVLDSVMTDWLAEPDGDSSVFDWVDHLWFPLCESVTGANVSLINNLGGRVLTQRGAGTPAYTKAGGYVFDGAHGLQIDGMTETTVVARHGQYHSIAMQLISAGPVGGNYIYVDNPKNDLGIHDNAGALRFFWSQGNGHSLAYPTLPCIVEVGNSRNYASNNYAHRRVNGVFTAGSGATNSFHVSVGTSSYIIGAKTAIATPTYTGPWTCGFMGFLNVLYHSSDSTLNDYYGRISDRFHNGCQALLDICGR